jgi:tripartite-type tricarboxylate transporter receptor subunit TctC
VQDLIAKAQHNTYHYASAGMGTAPHFAAELFNLNAGTKLLGSTYTGAAPAIADTVRGHTQLMFPSLFTAQPYLQSGKLRALAVAGPERLPTMHGVPTLAEQGVPGVEVTQWYALFAPARTPPDVVQELNQALNTVLKDPELVARMAADGARVQTSTPEQLQYMVSSEIAKWKRVAQLAHMPHGSQTEEA